MVFQVVTTKVVLKRCEKCRYVDWSSSTLGITGANGMCSVPVSRGKVLRLRVVDLHCEYGG